MRSVLYQKSPEFVQAQGQSAKMSKGEIQPTVHNKCLTTLAATLRQSWCITVQTDTHGQAEHSKTLVEATNNAIRCHGNMLSQEKHVRKKYLKQI